VTLALLHVEYLEKYPDGYRYTQFCELYRTWLGRRGLTMRLDHRAVDKALLTSYLSCSTSRDLAALARQTAAAVARWTALAMGLSVILKLALALA